LDAEALTERALGSARFAELVTEGAGLNVDGAIVFALEPPHPGPAAAVQDSPLSRREHEVATLIAAGNSNRAIAETLVLSPRTVDRHVERIMAKLAFNSRAQIAAWVARRAARQVG
jgi:DNA-binding NarL/FixJ family response regulator